MSENDVKIEQQVASEDENDYTPVPVKQLIQEFEKTCRPIMQYKKVKSKGTANHHAKDINRFFQQSYTVEKYQNNNNKRMRQHNYDHEVCKICKHNNGYSSSDDEEDMNDDDDDNSIDNSLSQIDINYKSPSVNETVDSCSNGHYPDTEIDHSPNATTNSPYNNSNQLIDTKNPSYDNQLLDSQQIIESFSAISEEYINNIGKLTFVLTVNMEKLG